MVRTSPGQRLGLDPPPLRVRVEPRVLERHRGLVREGLGEAHVVFREDPAARVRQPERADHLPLDGERHREDGPDLRGLEEREHVGGEPQPRVREHVVGDHGAPLDDRQPDRPGAAGVPQRVIGQGRLPGAGRLLERARLGIEAEDGGREHADQIPHAVHHPLGDPARMQRLGEGLAHVAERQALAAAPLGLREQPGVLERHRGLVREVWASRRSSSV